MARQVALLRGINVGAHRRIKMADLRAALETLGYEDVATLGVSGNVALTSDDAAADVATAIERVTAERCGVDGVRVVVRSRDELQAVVDANPWPDRTDRPKLLHVTFLSAEPSAAVRERVEASIEGADEVVWAGRDVYTWFAEGLIASALAKAMTDKTLGVTATDRNWNTVVKLLELAVGSAG